MEYYSVIKRNELSSHEKTWRNFKCTLRSGISQSEKTTFWERQNYGDSQKISGCQGREEGWMNRQGTVDFYGRETICTILQWWIHVITHLSKPVECMTSVRPEANSVLWVIMTCQCRFIICNKVPRTEWLKVIVSQFWSLKAQDQCQQGWFLLRL